MRVTAAMLLAAPLLLTACASPAQLAAERQARLAGYVGMSETALVHMLGAPADRKVNGDHTTLAYLKDYSEWMQASPFDQDPPELLGLDYNGLPPHLLVWSCETIFDIVGGKVAAAHQRGNYCGGAA
jgi:hypothetical protein